MDHHAEEAIGAAQVREDECRTDQDRHKRRALSEPNERRPP